MVREVASLPKSAGMTSEEYAQLQALREQMGLGHLKGKRYL